MIGATYETDCLGHCIFFFFWRCYEGSGPLIHSSRFLFHHLSSVVLIGAVLPRVVVVAVDMVRYHSRPGAAWRSQKFTMEAYVIGTGRLPNHSVPVRSAQAPERFQSKNIISWLSNLEGDMDRRQ